MSTNISSNIILQVLMAKGKLSHADAQEAVELAGDLKSSVEDVLVRCCYVSAEDVQTAQRMIKHATDPRLKTFRLGELLVAAQLVSPLQLEQALYTARKYNCMVGKILTDSGTVQHRVLQAALVCQEMLRKQMVQEEAAVVALNYCHRQDIRFQDALRMVA